MKQNFSISNLDVPVRSVTIRSDGRLMVRFSTGGKRYSVYGKTPEELREKLRRKQQKAAAELEEIEEGPPFSDYCGYYLNAKKLSIKTSSYLAEHSMLMTITGVSVRTPAVPFGNLRLKSISAEDVRAVQVRLRENHSTSSVNYCITLIKSVLRMAVFEKRIAENCAAAVRPLRRIEPKARNSIHRALTKQELRLFFQYAGDSYYRPLFTFLLNTGLRVGEAGALTAEDISGRKLYVRRTLTLDAGGHRVIGDSPKSATSIRFVPLTPDALSAIQTQLAADQQTARKNHHQKPDPASPVFVSPHGDYLNASAVNLEIRRICRRAGIEDFTLHAFRDTFATVLAESNMDMRTLMELLGHSDIKMTLGLYCHSDEERKSRLFRKISFDIGSNP